MPGQKAAETHILNGWKEIANYLGKGVRTVQRYEREQRLPIYRPARKSRGSVTAIKAELDRWVKAIPVQSDDRTTRLRAQSNALGAQFLQIDAEFALTLSNMAFKTSSSEQRERQSAAARKAYDSIMRLSYNLDLNETEKEKLDVKLRRLKSELQNLGERF
jgi:hypothetical protein